MPAERPMSIAVFPDRESAERAYRSLIERGYRREDINLVMSEETRKRHFGDDDRVSAPDTMAEEGAGVGGAIGGAVGATIALALVGGSVVLPGVGLVVAGPVAAALAGAGAGAASGGLVGALVGWSIPEEEMRRYEAELQRGGILLAVRPRSHADGEYFATHWNTSVQPAGRTGVP
ncbi:MAG: hypothetical protein KJ011_05805 [Burkholderiaceae bacterium]|nr:hypothetical protein [Burkholderiaceae bacterium]